MSGHECPRDGCTRQVPAHMLMCRADWYQVPRPLRDVVWATWQDGAGAGTPAHLAAVCAAIAAVSARQEADR